MTESTNVIVTPAEWQPHVEELQQRVCERIAILEAMGVQVEAFDGQRIHLSAPLNRNYNDKGTGFAGSIASLAALSGWAFLTLQLTRRYGERHGQAETAIYHCDLSYDAPVNNDFYAVAELAPEADLADFFAQLDKRGRAKINVVALIMEGDLVKARLTAKYFARLPGLDKTTDRKPTRNADSTS